MGRIKRGGVGMAANPHGAHQVGRVFADCVTAYVVAIFAGVLRVGAARYACSKFGDRGEKTSQALRRKTLS
jgi:hypothetical protein